jgi:hypothetical protein
MTTNTAPGFRYIGVTDECVECQKCGKTELRATVVLAILDADGNTEDVTYYGSTCAARALAERGTPVKGGGRAVLQSARWAQERLRTEADDARRMLAYYGLPETGEPDDGTIREAMRLYVRHHPNIHEWVKETGVGVRARVLDMLARKRAVLAEAALVGL